LLLLVGDLEFVQDFFAEHDEGSAQGLHELLAVLIRHLGGGSLERLAPERSHGQSHHSDTEANATLHRVLPFSWSSSCLQPIRMNRRPCTVGRNRPAAGRAFYERRTGPIIFLLRSHERRATVSGAPSGSGSGVP